MKTFAYLCFSLLISLPAMAANTPLSGSVNNDLGITISVDGDAAQMMFVKLNAAKEQSVDISDLYDAPAGTVMSIERRGSAIICTEVTTRPKADYNCGIVIRQDGSSL